MNPWVSAGSSVLTGQGRGWLLDYELFVRRMEEEKDRLFQEFFGKRTHSG